MPRRRQSAKLTPARRGTATPERAEPARAIEGDPEGPVLFVSYSHTDAELVRGAVRSIRNVAESCGFALFFDQREIRPGDAWASRIEGALRRARAAVVFLSDDYLDTERYAASELEAILARFRLGKLRTFIVPLRRIDTYLPKEFEELPNIQWALPKDRPIVALAPAEREEAFHQLNDVIGQQLDPDSWGKGEPRSFEEFAKSEVRRTLDRKYEVQESVGAGRSSVVFRARDTALGRDVALKVLVHARYESDLALEFVERAQVAARIRHGSIAQVLTSQLNSSPYYLVMEYIKGSTLEEEVARRGPLEGGPALRYFEQVASALSCIHSHGVVHGAIRPSNILFDATDPEGRAVLSVHWLRGVKGRRQSGLTLEELTYLTPEQYDGEAADAKSDQYQLGQLLCELLTGAPPARVGVLKDFEKKQHSFAQPVPPSLDGVSVGRRAPFREALRRMLCRDPGARWPSIAEAARAIRRAMEAESGDSSLPLARQSFDRCAAGTTFFPLVYRELFALRPDLEGLFHEVDLQRQYVRLRAALVALFDASEGTVAVQRTIEDYGKQHAQMAVRSEDYDAFLEAICRAARGSEGAAWTPGLEEAWRTSLQPGIEQMKRLAAPSS